MPQLSVSVVHRLGADDAKLRVEQALTEAIMEGEFQVSWNWKQERIAVISMAMQGQKFAGSLTVTPSTVSVIVELSFMSWFSRSQIENEIRSRLQRALIKAFLKGPVDANDGR